MSDSNNAKPPTPKARQLARQQGRVALSGDLATAISLIGSVIIVYLYSGRILESAALMLSSQLSTAHVAAREMGTESAASITRLFQVLAECILAVLVFVIVAWSVQTGFLFAVRRVFPDINRINPLHGAQRMFSASNLTQAILNLLKIAIIAGASYAFFRSNVDSIAGISQLQLSQLAKHSGSILYELMLICVGALVLIGIVDYAVKRNQFEASLSSTNDDSRTTVRSVKNDPSSAQANRYRAPLVEEPNPDVK
ncbi:EscU/YscU/HrcU family type III secretion system export apparatus switch protein [Planctomycetota bacterium]